MKKKAKKVNKKKCVCKEKVIFHGRSCICEDNEVFDITKENEIIKMNSENIIETPEHCSSEVDRLLESDIF